jgi:glycosyltransferase involved in cell wall biosynthesis
MTTLPGGRSPIVVVHDALGHLGGQERVLEAILASHPEAELIAPLFAGGDPDGALAFPWPNPTTVAFTARRKRHALGPLYVRRMARASLGPAGVVVAVAHGGWSLGVRVPDGARFLVYLAGPPSALYEERHLYLPEYPLALRPLFVAATPALRRANRRLVQRADRILTSSRWAAREIEARYGREAEVLYPPVDTGFLTPDGRDRRHALVVARLVASKRVEVVLEAFRHLPERLVVAGCGPELERLRRLATPNVEFAGHVTDAELRDLYRSSTALVCPSREEFGLVHAEALACGTPVIAPAEAGALEIVDPGRTGLFLDSVDPPSIASALAALRRTPIDPEACRQSAQRFSQERFTARFEQVLAEELSLASAMPRPRAPVGAAAR